MFAGHFGLAAGVKAGKHSVPLWVLMLSTQLLDVIFVILVLSGGIESLSGGGYGKGIIHAYYTHSLVGALLISLVAGLIAWRLWELRGGLVVAGMVFSHWILDLLVHRPDLPLLPGNLGNLPMLGFGLWNMPTVTIVLEALLIAAGAIIYFVSARARGIHAQRPGGQKRAIIAGLVMAVFLVLSLVTDVIGIG